MINGNDGAARVTRALAQCNSILLSLPRSCNIMLVRHRFQIYEQCGCSVLLGGYSMGVGKEAVSLGWLTVGHIIGRRLPNLRLFGTQRRAGAELSGSKCWSVAPILSNAQVDQMARHCTGRKAKHREES